MFGLYKLVDKHSKGPRLLVASIVGGNDSCYTDKGSRSTELIELLDDPVYDVKRQALLFLGAHKVKEAIPAIEKLLKEDVETKTESQSNALKNMAREALDKITGKNKSPYWEN